MAAAGGGGHDLSLNIGVYSGRKKLSLCNIVRFPLRPTDAANENAPSPPFPSVGMFWLRRGGRSTNALLLPPLPTNNEPNAGRQVIDRIRRKFG